MKKTSLWELFWTFFKIGLFTFGGGYAMVAIIEKEVVAKKKWATDSDMLDILVIAESTPGVLAVNTATSIGYRTRGLLGACMATLAVVLPSFLIIFGLSFLIDAFQDNKWYKAAFAGIQVSVCVLIINAFTKMFKQLKHSVFDYVMMLVGFGVALFTSFSVIYIIICGAAIGLVYSLILEKRNKTKQQAALTGSVLDENTESIDQVFKDSLTDADTESRPDDDKSTDNNQSHTSTNDCPSENNENKSDNKDSTEGK